MLLTIVPGVSIDYILHDSMFLLVGFTPVTSFLRSAGHSLTVYLFVGLRARREGFVQAVKRLLS
jgi:hypothetical protein